VHICYRSFKRNREVMCGPRWTTNRIRGRHQRPRMSLKFLYHKGSIGPWIAPSTHQAGADATKKVRVGDGRVGLYAGFCALARGARAAAIHLGLPSPAGSSGLPAGSGGPPSIACAGHHLAAVALLALLRVGFT